MTRSLTLKFKILGRTWTLKIYTKRKYQKKCGVDSVACCKGWKRTLCLSPAGFRIETIYHEIFHAYLHEATGGLILDVDTLEEVMCEVMAKRGAEFLKLGRKLRRDVRRLTGR